MLPLSLSFLKPDENGMVSIKSAKSCSIKFTSTIPYEKAVTHVREGSAYVASNNTILKFHSQKQMRQLIFTRDNGKCHYCGDIGTTLDHKLPRSKGGCSTPKNLVCCCRKCNVKKGILTYNEFLKMIDK